jgi:hypothetical protein
MQHLLRCLVAALVLSTTPAWGQESGSPSPSRPGPTIPGQPAIDPTENVKALNEAAGKRQDDLRLQEDKFQNAMRDAETRRINDLRISDNQLRDAETRRINELAAQKQIFDLELARVIRAALDSSTLLLATQLKEVKTDLSDRTAKLEQFRWESGGVGTGRSDFAGWVAGAFGILIAMGTMLVPLFRSPRRTP